MSGSYWIDVLPQFFLTLQLSLCLNFLCVPTPVLRCCQEMNPFTTKHSGLSLRPQPAQFAWTQSSRTPRSIAVNVLYLSVSILKPIAILRLCLFSIPLCILSFNAVLSSTPRSSTKYSPMRVSNKNFVCLLTCVLYNSQTFLISSFEQIYIINSS